MGGSEILLENWSQKVCRRDSWGEKSIALLPTNPYRSHFERILEGYRKVTSPQIVTFQFPNFTLHPSFKIQRSGEGIHSEINGYGVYI